MAEIFEVYQRGNLFFSNKEEAFQLVNQSSFGELKSGKVVYSLYEALYLLENKKIKVISTNKNISFETLIKKAENEIYAVFKDLRDKGNIVKEGLKFGTDFRVYEKGQKPGKSHAKYLAYVIQGNKSINIKDFSAKTRIAHSTHKILLLAIVDSEEDITYYEINWKSS